MPIDFNSLKIKQPLDLGVYHPAYEGSSLEVWVNPARGVWRAYYDETTAEEERVKAFYCAIWDIEPAGYDELAESAEPGLWSYLVNTSTELLNAHIEQRKNAGAA